MLNMYKILGSISTISLLPTRRKLVLRNQDSTGQWASVRKPEKKYLVFL